jgi:hypothetical protein
MEPSSFQHTFPFVPPEVLCGFHETGPFSRLGAVLRAFRRFLLWS